MKALKAKILKQLQKGLNSWKVSKWGGGGEALVVTYLLVYHLIYVRKCEKDPLRPHLSIAERYLPSCDNGPEFQR